MESHSAESLEGRPEFRVSAEISPETLKIARVAQVEPSGEPVFSFASFLVGYLATHVLRDIRY